MPKSEKIINEIGVLNGRDYREKSKDPWSKMFGIKYRFSVPVFPENGKSKEIYLFLEIKGNSRGANCMLAICEEVLGAPKSAPEGEDLEFSDPHAAQVVVWDSTQIPALRNKYCR